MPKRARMIESAEIVLFQPWEYVTLEFLPGVNVIKGTSNEGKSSIMRALRWNLFNYQPQKTNWKSHFADDKDEHSVGIAFTDEQWVLRLKGKENNYLAEGLELAAVGTVVPDEIKKITQISDINFQSQDDRYFLLNKSPGVAGKMLNEFVGLQIIDESRTKINGMIRGDKQKLEIVKENIKGTKKQLEAFKHLDKAERLVNRIDLLQREKDKVSSRKHAIETLCESLGFYKEDLEHTKAWLEVREDYEMLVSEQEKLNICSSKRSKIENIYSAIREHEKQREIKAQTLEIDSESYSDLEKKLDYCQSCGAHKKYWRK
jgi:exonuclease SbcC